MSTVNYNQAIQELGVSRSAIERRLKLTGVPVQYIKGRVHFDLETLQDAWAGRQAARPRATVGGASLVVGITPEQRRALEELKGGESLASAARRVLQAGLEALAD